MYDAKYDNIDSVQLDVLKELGNIGSGNATTALSEMIDKEINMSVPIVRVLAFKEIANILGGAEKLVAGIMMGIKCDVTGMIMFVLEQGSAHHLVNMLMGKKLDSFEDFDEMDCSALKEIGNIISAAYLNSVAAMTNLNIVPTIPYLSIDMAGAILSVPAIQFSKLGENALLIQSEFEDDKSKVTGYFIFIPEEAGYIKIMESLGIDI